MSTLSFTSSSFVESFVLSGYSSADTFISFPRSHPATAKLQTLWANERIRLQANSNALAHTHAFIFVGILVSPPRRFYIAWRGAIHFDTSSLLVPHSLLRDFSISPPAIAEITLVRDNNDIEKKAFLKSVEKVGIVPENADDWEIVELNAKYLVNNLLKSVAIFNSAYPLTIQLGKSQSVRLCVEDQKRENKEEIAASDEANEKTEKEKSKENFFIPIGTNTELIVAPKLRTKSKADSAQINPPASALPALQNSTSASSTEKQSTSKLSSTNHSVRFRVQALDTSLFPSSLSPLPPQCVLIHPNDLQKYGWKENELMVIYRSQTKSQKKEEDRKSLPNGAASGNGSLQQSSDRSSSAALPPSPADSLLYSFQSFPSVSVVSVRSSFLCQHSHCIVPSELRHSLQLTFGQITRLSPVTTFSESAALDEQKGIPKSVIASQKRVVALTICPVMMLAPAPGAAHSAQMTSSATLSVSTALPASSWLNGHQNDLDELESNELVEAFRKWLLGLDSGIVVVDGSVIPLRIERIQRIVYVSVFFSRSISQSLSSQKSEESSAANSSTPAVVSSPAQPQASFSPSLQQVSLSLEYLMLSSSILSSIPSASIILSSRLRLSRVFDPLIDSVAASNLLPNARLWSDKDSVEAPLTMEEVGGWSEMLDKAAAHIQSGLTPPSLEDAVSFGDILISGAASYGKTSFSLAVSHYFRHLPPFLCSVSFFSCTDFVNASISALLPKFRAIFSFALAHSPTLLVLDDLDLLCPAVQKDEGGTDAAAALRSAQIAEVLQDALEEVRERRKHAPFVLLATAKSLTALYSALQSPAIFSTVLELKSPDRAAREEIFQRLVGPLERAAAVNVERKVDWQKLSSKCEGFVAEDIQHVLKRAMHFAAARQTQRKENEDTKEEKDDRTTEEKRHEGAERKLTAERVLHLTMKDFSSALQNYRPVALRNIATTSTSGAPSWDDIGGLELIRQTLKDTIELPSRWQRLFSSLPLTIRSGLLLYGAPGTGKTMLAAAVAKECGLNFITVKGPELLNKYIGASEAAVRDVFARARAAAPCVLFFDEFESIAPKRGADSTGVTDRVVNQFLCELDGVEARSAAVFILAASSRPDLIDPALLRPGRIDKSLLCPMPEEKERQKILKAVLRKAKVAEGLQLEELARKTHYFSGADLRALVTNAQIEIIQQTISELEKQKEKELENGIQTGKEKGIAVTNRAIEQQDLENALEAMGPSLSSKQRSLYDKVYEKFITSREQQDNDFNPKGKLKTTFA